MVNYYGQSSNTANEPNMREEMISTLEGDIPEIAKGQRVLYRQLRLDSSGNPIACPCVSKLTGEPDKDRACPICFGEGFYFDETYILAYRTLESADNSNALQDRIIPAGIVAVPLVVFYTRYDVPVSAGDKIVMVHLNADGSVKTPVRRKGVYRVVEAWDYRSDNAKLEYWKIYTHRENVKHLNSLAFDPTANDV